MIRTEIDRKEKNHTDHYTITTTSAHNYVKRYDQMATTGPNRKKTQNKSNLLKKGGL